MVVTHLVLAGRGVTGATVLKGVDGAPITVIVFVVVIIIDAVAVVTGGGLFVNVATGLARVVWISALRARAVLSFSRICSICSCSSCSSPGQGGATAAGVGVTVEESGTGAFGGEGGAAGGAALGWEEEDDGSESTKLAKEAVGPPFSHILLLGTTPGLTGPSSSFLLPPPLGSEAAMRASSRRVLRVSRLKWTLLKSLASLAVAAAAVSLLVSLFHLAETPGAGGAGGPGGS